MAAPKGHPRYGGRAKGQPNKVTSTLRVFVKELLDDNREQIKKDLKSKKLQPKDRLYFFEKLLNYALPKQQSTTANVNLSTMADEQLNEIISGINYNLDQEESEGEE